MANGSLFLNRNQTSPPSQDCGGRALWTSISLMHSLRHSLIASGALFHSSYGISAAFPFGSCQSRYSRSTIAQRLLGGARNPKDDCTCGHEEKMLVRNSVYHGLHHSSTVLTPRTHGAGTISLHRDREECRTSTAGTQRLLGCALQRQVEGTLSLLVCRELSSPPVLDPPHGPPAYQRVTRLGA